MAKTRKLWLSQEQTGAILDVAKSENPEALLILQLCRYGLRDGEILGTPPKIVSYKRRVNRHDPNSPLETVTETYSLPGLKKGDLRPNGIWLVGKGYTDEPPDLYPLPAWLAAELNAFSAERPGEDDGKLFSIGVRRLEQLVKQYAKQAGVEDWQLVKPHRLRAFFATDLEDRGYEGFTIRNAMRHASIITTNEYVGRNPIRRAKIMEALERP